MDITAFLFDLDDTLLDRSRSMRELARLFMGRYTARLSDRDDERAFRVWVAADASGYKPRPLMAREVLSSLDWRQAPRAEEIESFWRGVFPSCSVLEEGAEELLALLRERGVKIGVITNSRTDFQKAKIAHVGIGKYLDLLFISEEVGVEKPDPRIFSLAMEKLGAVPERTIFVGDNPEVDIDGARNVGMRVIWKKASLPWPDALPRPERSVEKLGEISAMLRDGGVLLP